MSIFFSYSDGGARGNPGPSAIGVVIKDAAGATLKEIREYIGEGTNNQAEYLALIKALEIMIEHNASQVVCHLDSELVVKQMKLEYKVKDAKLQQLFLRAINLSRKIGRVEYKHIRRELNSHADALVNKALDERAG